MVGIFSRVASVFPGDVKCPTWNVRPADVPADALRVRYDHRSPPNGSLLPTFFSTGRKGSKRLLPFFFSLSTSRHAHPSPIPPVFSCDSSLNFSLLQFLFFFFFLPLDFSCSLNPSPNFSSFSLFEFFSFFSSRFFPLFKSFSKFFPP